MAQHAQSQSYQDYTIGWICVLEPEYIAARAMLDHTNQKKLPAVHGDSNNYTFGQIGEHNVVIASLPSGTYGTNPAAVVATQMARSFPDLRFILLVGIGGGVPQMTSDPNDDIYLGDVVVSNPTGKSVGVVQYDLGKMHEGAPRPTQTGTLDKPPGLVRTAVASLKASHGFKSSPLTEHLSKMAEQYPTLVPKYQYQGRANDVLFHAGYGHEGNSSTCDNCLQDKVVRRAPRETTQPRIHYGTIASGNQVVKDSVTREFWGKEAGVLCFEMEAAGLMDPFPCLVIRGICDYADSHKNQRWQNYAAATAAAYAKDLLLEIAPIAVQEAETPLRGS